MAIVNEEHSEGMQEEAALWLDHADRELKSMQALVSDLLDYAALDSERGESAEVSVSELLAGIATGLDEGAELVFASELPTLLTHRTLLTQLFTNLVENGMKYNHADRKQVVVDVVESDADRIFSFKDNGIGIAEKDLQRIFNPFQRLHGPKEYSGTGLGLAICARIVELLHGQIWAESESGSGSTFFVSLPK